MSLISAFTGAVGPILVIAAVGYLLTRVADIDVTSLNTVGLYVLVPALAFHSIATTDLSGAAIVKLGVGVIAYALVMVGVAWIAGRLVGESGPLLGAMMLAAAIPNSGFIGIPLSEFAFGDVGRTTAVLYLTIQNLIVYTLGVYIASRGTDRSALRSVKEIFRLPLVYAVIAAVLVRGLGLVPTGETALMETLRLVGDSSIPIMLLILGVQLADTDVSAVSRTVTPSVLKLGVAPMIGIGIALALGFDNPTVARVFILECATPAAVIPLALIIEYADVRAVDGITAPEYLSTTIFVTTVIGTVVLTALVALLQSGVIV
ncbi:AEC family transporter [Haloarcula litorea]|uniref:AEC family transporter n=1 Tax=Haloarcula litorea TaxID=3032579 RepID=UPI0023E89583|nr:AEC family transporter [Halomicroarcula sp. GDY20]